MRGYKNFDSDPHPGDLRHMIEIGYTEKMAIRNLRMWWYAAYGPL